MMLTVLKLQVPVLEFHGLDDRAYVSESLDGTWQSVGCTETTES